MKALDWQRQLQTQHIQYGKAVFSVTELAHLSGSAPHVLNVELARLQKQQIIVRYAQGRYGLPDVVTPEILLPCLDSGAYITGMYALHRHNLVTQRPVEITCFTNRRHNRSRVRQTPLGRFVFICVAPSQYAPPADGSIALPEQALCDFVTLMQKQGLASESLVTFRALDRLNDAALAEAAGRHSRAVRAAIERITGRSLASLPA